MVTSITEKDRAETVMLHIVSDSFQNMIKAVSHQSSQPRPPHHDQPKAHRTE
jgi:hypothetical protein